MNNVPKTILFYGCKKDKLKLKMCLSHKLLLNDHTVKLLRDFIIVNLFKSMFRF